MELAGILGIPHSRLDETITTRDFIRLTKFYRKHKRFPGQSPSLI